MSVKNIITRIQEVKLDPAAEYQRFVDALSGGEGAVVMFTGHVRAIADQEKIHALTLEHYPAMTEKILARLAEDSAEKFSLNRLTVLHRVGRMVPGETIVITIAAASHRRDAFAAAELLVDRLKTQAPFWKKEECAAGTRWIAQKGSTEFEQQQIKPPVFGSPD